MVKLFDIPNLFSTIFIFSVFMRVSEGAFFLGCYRKGTLRRTLSRCQDLAMCSHDACNAGVARAAWALWALCVGARGRDVGGTGTRRAIQAGTGGLRACPTGKRQKFLVSRA